MLRRQGWRGGLTAACCAAALLGIVWFADHAHPAAPQANGFGGLGATTDSTLIRDAMVIILTGAAIVIALLGLSLCSARRAHRETVASQEAMRRELDSRLQCVTADLAERDAAVRRMWQRLDAVRDDERRRIARDLHDDLSSTLVALQLEMSEYTGVPASGRQVRRRRAGADLVDGALQAMHSLVSDMRASLDSHDPWERIPHRVRQYERITRIRCQIEMPAGLAQPPPEVAIVMYRLVDEALTNVVRHSGASQVVVKIQSTPFGLALEVSDNGRGIDPDAAISPESFGLIGMRERAESIGGTFNVSPGTNGGTTVRLHVPAETRYAANA